MPYIDEERRDDLEPEVPYLEPGDLNYAITRLCQRYLKDHAAGSAPRYHHYMEVIGTLECVKLEYYRRAVAPYEDTKKMQNGDVYD